MFNDKAIALLIKMCEVGEKAIFNTMKDLLSHYYEEIYTVENQYIYAVGKNPIGLVAHLDTVWAHQVAVKKEGNTLTSAYSDQGIGADDRCGVFLITKMLQYIPEERRPSIIFTCGEETGGFGATTLITDFEKPKVKLKFMLELDRHGVNDCAMYDCGNADFKKFISTFGYEPVNGIFTDISIIGPAWDCACGNLSCGFQNEHTTSEYIDLKILYNTYNEVMFMLASDTPYYDYQGPDWVMEKVKCDCCRKKFLYKNTIVYKNKCYCYFCADKRLNFCRVCFNPFPKSKHSVCPECNKKRQEWTSHHKKKI